MNEEQKLNLFEKVCQEELMKAVQKHPMFANGFHAKGIFIEDVKAHLKNIRKANDDTNYHSATMILEEEITEAVESYLEGRTKDCIVELAQCVAVINRMMLMVMEESEPKEIKEVKKQLNVLWQEELQDEYNQLNKQILRLGNILISDSFKELGVHEQNFMLSQHHSMLAYKLALIGRGNLYGMNLGKAQAGG